MVDCNRFDEGELTGPRGELINPRKAWEESTWGLGYRQSLIEVVEEDVTSLEDSESENTTDDEGPRLPVPKVVFSCPDTVPC